MPLRLLDLPVELLENILFYVPPSLLITRVGATCRKLRDVLQSESFWKRRYVALVRGPAPLQESWQYWHRGCVQYAFASRLVRGEGAMKIKPLTGPTGGLDCVHLMFPVVHGAVGLVAAGSRDSCVYVWRRRTSQAGSEEGRRSMRSSIMYTMDGHKGWVWCLNSDPHRPELLCSGGWDYTVRVWDAVIGKPVLTIAKQHKGAVLAMDFPQPSCLVTSSYDKRVREFDLRVPVSLVADHQEHKKPVLAVASSEHYVYSGGEDNSVCVWDRRGRGILQTVKLNSLVKSVHCGYGRLSCAGQTTVTIFDSSQGTLNQISSYCPFHSFYSSLTCVLHNMGMIATGSRDDTVAIHSPAHGHTHMTTLHRHKSDVTGLDCSQNALAIASSDNTVTLWTPGPHYFT